VAEILEHRSFETPLGEIWFWGDAEAFKSTETTVVVITGSFAGPQAMRGMPRRLAGMPVLISDLPGNRCPPTAIHSVGAYAAAYSAALEALARPIKLCGVSLGGIVALGVRAPQLKSILALEPVLRAENAAPLWPVFRQMLRDRPNDPYVRPFLWNLFGLDETRSEPRDYFPILQGLNVPTIVAGGEATCDPPTFLPQEDRARLAAYPEIQIVDIPDTGHTMTEEFAAWAARTLRG
jgi:pimeloyl-ACP methyl ester carboxylesterase